MVPSSWRATSKNGVAATTGFAASSANFLTMSDIQALAYSFAARLRGLRHHTGGDTATILRMVIATSNSGTTDLTSAHGNQL